MRLLPWHRALHLISPLEVPLAKGRHRFRVFVDARKPTITPQNFLAFQTPVSAGQVPDPLQEERRPRRTSVSYGLDSYVAVSNPG